MLGPIAMTLPIADLTATATLILGAITFALVIATVALVMVTRAAADEARGEALAQLKILERQFGAEHRPLLVDVLLDGPIPADMPRPDEVLSQDMLCLLPATIYWAGVPSGDYDPRAILVAGDERTVRVSVPLRNVGRGLAVVDAGGIEVAGQWGWPLSMVESVSVYRRQVPVGETTRIEIAAGIRAQEAPPNQQAVLGDICITVPYTDFAGQQRAVVRMGLVELEQDQWAQPRRDGERDRRGPWRIRRVEQTAPYE